MNRTLLLSLLPLALCGRAAAQSLKVTGLTQAGNQITVTVQNTGASTSFRLESSPTMSGGTWNAVAGASFAPVAGQNGFHRATVTRPAGTKLFYRVVGISGTSDDTDGDGLANAFEATLGTNPALFDTDGDGFSDGVEFGFNTNPLLASSKPVFTDRATVNFTALNSTATEGTSPHQIPVAFDRPFSGTVKYAVSNMGNTVAGTDFQAVSGNLVFNNASTATIPLILLDNTTVSGQRAVILELQVNGEAYYIGGQGTHIVMLNDNDAWWTGTLIPASGEAGDRSFRVKITHQAGATAATFAAGSGIDGLPVPAAGTSPEGVPAITATNTSSAIVPVGAWPGTVIADTAARFSISSPVLTATAGTLLGNQAMGRTLLLNAQPSLSGPGHLHLLGPGRIIGDYTETLTTPAPVTTLATLPGTVVLVRDLPAPLPVLSKLVPVTP